MPLQRRAFSNAAHRLAEMVKNRAGNLFPAVPGKGMLIVFSASNAHL